MFHALGFAQALVGVGFGSTLVIRRRFDPEETLRSVEHHRASAMVMVPVMLQRAVDKLEEMDTRPDTSSLRIIFLSGSALGADLAVRSMKSLGPVVYNLYGSTEVAYATIATPEDLRVDPSTVGKVVRGSVVKLFDEHSLEVPQGETGRIFVGNLGQFEGYTGGGSKEMIEGLMSSGDVGHFDDQGRLFIDGRDDEMIVSGGENVFPAEVEQLLAGHEAVSEAAVIGVEDQQFGQRLKAFVVTRWRGQPFRGRGQGLRQGQPRQVQGPARGRVRRRAPPERDRQGAQARARRESGGARFRAAGRRSRLTASGDSRVASGG